MVECRGTLTDALGGNRGYDFAADAAGYACPACGKFMDFFADYEGEDMNHCNAAKPIQRLFISATCASLPWNVGFSCQYLSQF